MTDSDGSYRCPDCNKAYKTRTSLTRHSRNHAPGVAKQYACDTCGVVFARRDILNRHVVNGHCGKDGRDGKGAGRCHTACEGCRRSRVRCDGQDPCKACVERNKECKYPKSTGRVSWLTRVRRPAKEAIDDPDRSEGHPLEAHLDATSTKDALCDTLSTNSSSTKTVPGPTSGAIAPFPNMDANGVLGCPTQQRNHEHQSRHMHHTGPLSSTDDLGPVTAISEIARPLPSGAAYLHSQHDDIDKQRLHPDISTESINSAPGLQNQLSGVHSNITNKFRPALNGHIPTAHAQRDRAFDDLGRPLGITNIGTSNVIHQNGSIFPTGPVANGIQHESIPVQMPNNNPAISLFSHQSQTNGNHALQAQHEVSHTRHLMTLQRETGYEKPLETNPEVHHVPWAWLHERSFMGMKARGKSGGRTSSPLEPTVNGHESTPDSLGSPAEMDAGYRELITPLANVIESLVAYAANTAFSPESRAARRHYWETTSIQLFDIFHAHGDRSIAAPRQTLYTFAESFLERFNVLWPLIGFEQLDPDSNHPVLFLVVTSIGAMFRPSAQRQYGALMHVRLRRLLCASLYDLEGPPGDEMIWLAQARLLTQIASLHLGQHQGFSYSQHLAAITIAQMRRMEFFREAIPDITSHVWRPPEDEFARWQYAETKRRLALGILRTDAYNSVLLSTRPLLTSEEVNLTFPRPDRLWLNEDAHDLQGQLQARRDADKAILPMPLSDLVRIFLDREEAKPDLSTVGYELSLFGLQEWVWRFSHDTELYFRLTGRCLDETWIDAPRTLPARDMKEVRSDFARLTHALDGWLQSFERAIARGDFDQHRDTLMCCRLLYQLSQLRLCSPLEELHHVSYRAAETPTIDANIFRKVHAWMRSPFAPKAAKQAWEIKTVIEDELRRPAKERARFNFLAFCSLHHSAVVLWTYAGVFPTKTDNMIFSPPYEDVEAFIRDCASMFSQLSPLGGLSFESAARRLHNYRFPQYLPQYHEAVR